MNQDVLTTEFYFASGVYITNCPQFLDDCKTVLDKRLEGKEEVNEIYPVCQTDWMFDESLVPMLDYIAKTGWNVLESQGYDMKYYNTNITDFWGQKLMKHGQQVEHVHGGSAQLVGFYFVEVPENSTRPFISDPRPAKVQINLPERDMTQATLGSQKINFKVKPGDLLITNAWLPHGFLPNGSDEPFKFVHFIISATPANRETFTVKTDSVVVI